MKLTEEQHQEITEMASALMPINDICIIMGLDIEPFKIEMQDPESEVYKAHQSGFLKSKYQVQRKIVDLASAGSSPAQTQAYKLILAKEIDD